MFDTALAVRVGMTVTVGWLAPSADCWDANVLQLLFANQLYNTGVEFTHTAGYPNRVDGCVLVLPGRYWFRRCNEVSEALSRYQWVLAVRTSDEEDQLDPYNIVHNNIKWWVQTPRTGRDYDGARLFGVGFPPHFNDLKPQDRDTDVFLSAQNTHARRNECFDAVERVKGLKIIRATEGFTQGMDAAEYALWMSAAKVAPCPAGPESPDSFRLYEALQAHTVPIADDVTPAYGSAGYWRHVHPDAPFPVLERYSDLPGYVQDQLKAWPANVNRITAWWMRYKRQMARWLVDDLTELGAL